MKRSDPHSPSSLIPDDYRFLFGYAHPSSYEGWAIPGYNMALLLATRSGKRETVMGAEADPLKVVRRQGDLLPPAGFPTPTEVITFSDVHKGGACDICGAWHIEGSVFLHVPTGKAIAIGWQCAEKMELDYDASERAKIKGDRKAARASVIAKAKRMVHLKEFVAGARGSDLLKALKLDHHITRSIRSQVLRGRTLTGPQIDLVLKLWLDAEERAAQPEWVRVVVPWASTQSRTMIKGTVVGLKVHENAFGSSLKMTVKVTEPNGSWLCWGTVPAGLDGPLRGCVIRFTARLTISPTDESFSFFRRPTKASIVKLGPEAVEDLDKLQGDLERIREDESDSGSWFDGQVEKAADLELLR